MGRFNSALGASLRTLHLNFWIVVSLEVILLAILMVYKFDVPHGQEAIGVMFGRNQLEFFALFMLSVLCVIVLSIWVFIDSYKFPNRKYRYLSLFTGLGNALWIAVGALLNK